ncbi:MAG: ABC transporter ATP-binding protein [Pseudonocardia sp.]|nr:ABC transporter ATP-binding protein [Pseudonocardia sp.]
MNVTTLLDDAARVRPGPPAIELDGVTRRFGAVTAVDGLSLRVAQGEVVALLGPNGAGKTTTVDLLLGLARPGSGQVRVLGRPPAAAVAEGLVSAVMQTGGLLKDLTVAETVEYVAALFGSTRDVGEVLEQVGLADRARRRVGRCSGGEQQRLRFALALLPDPALLVLDEPTTGMDVGGRRAFWSAMRSVARRGATIVFATHYLAEADEFADRIVMLRAGRVVADGTADQVKAMASGRTVRAHLPAAPEPAVVAALYTVPGVRAVQVDGAAVTVLADDADAAARFLLTHTPARDLHVTSRSLDDAFVALAGSVQELP